MKARLKEIGRDPNYAEERLALEEYSKLLDQQADAKVRLKAAQEDLEAKLDIPLKRVASKSLLEDGDVVFVDASEDDEGTSRHVVVVKW